MAKRSAGVQLTADNFEREEVQEEEGGEFKKASEEELKRREIKKAKRTLPPGKVSTNPFSQLKLFNLSTTALPPPPPNSFIQLVPGPKATPSLFNHAPPTCSTSGKDSNKNMNKLKDLNVSVAEWISQHVKKNPHIDLTPVFEDYKKYLNELAEEKECAMEKENVDKGGDDGKMEEEEEGEGAESGVQKPVKELPVNIESSDDGSLLNVRCKLFYKKDQDFVELGLGNLKVTSGGEKGGVCLLLRNDTAMKKVLLNVHLADKVPLSIQKNRLLFVCIPNPPLSVTSSTDKKESSDSSSQQQQQPVTYLVKVKDEYIAKNLHSVISSNM